MERKTSIYMGDRSCGFLNELTGQDSERRKFNIMHLVFIEIAHYLGDYLFVVGKLKNFKPNETFVCLIDVERKERGNSDDTFGKKSSKRE